MGNFHSAHMQCLIENPVDDMMLLQPGEHLRGVIQLQIHNVDMVKQSFDGITIVVAGVEYIFGIPSPPNNNNNKDVKNDKKGEEMAMVAVPTNKVVKVTTFLPLTDDLLTRGEHEIPFSIAMPTREEHAEHHRRRRCGQSSLSSSSPQHQQQQQLPTNISSSKLLGSEDDLSLSAEQPSMSESDVSSSTSWSPWSFGASNHKKFIPPVEMATAEEGGESPSSFNCNNVVVSSNKTIVYHVKARLKRKKNVPLSVDTDIQCHASSASS